MYNRYRLEKFQQGDDEKDFWLRYHSFALSRNFLILCIITIVVFYLAAFGALVTIFLTTRIAIAAGIAYAAVVFTFVFWIALQIILVVLIIRGSMQGFIRENFGVRRNIVIHIAGEALFALIQLPQMLNLVLHVFPDNMRDLFVIGVYTVMVLETLW
jgi:hypothetical protein